MGLFEVYETDYCGTAVGVMVTQSEKKAAEKVEEIIREGGEAWYEQIQ